MKAFGGIAIGKGYARKKKKTLAIVKVTSCRN